MGVMYIGSTGPLVRCAGLDVHSGCSGSAWDRREAGARRAVRDWPSAAAPRCAEQPMLGRVARPRVTHMQCWMWTATPPARRAMIYACAALVRSVQLANDRSAASPSSGGRAPVVVPARSGAAARSHWLMCQLRPVCTLEMRSPWEGATAPVGKCCCRTAAGHGGDGGKRRQRLWAPGRCAG